MKKFILVVLATVVLSSCNSHGCSRWYSWCMIQ
ncbi:lipoprotein [Paracoccus kondratievae]